MPLIKISNNNFPDWCEVKKIKNFEIKKEDPVEIENHFSKMAIFFIEGNCEVSFEKTKDIFLQGKSILTELKTLNINSISEKAFMTVIQGNWENEIGNYGIFTMENSLKPVNIGDPVDYERETDFDNHYHDCDEYWIILKGSGVAVSEGIKYNFKAGDCIATKAGEHHDLPKVNKKIHGIYFETTLKGEKRLGHLWDHTHKSKVNKSG